MSPLMLEGPDVLILLAVVVLLFGGAKLAGIGKSAGRAIREFKEETRGLTQSDTPRPETPPTPEPRVAKTTAPTASASAPTISTTIARTPSPIHASHSVAHTSDDAPTG